ncbi:MAG: BatA and WFA domain-containing protein [Planctomycetaceae bacterium]|nr:BatA and WFA domain-containing protein [Planctomycetaceae bacterium]
MSFALPIAFTLAVLALPIVALYILKVRLRRVPVSTNLFWKQIYEEKPPRSIWQHFRHLVSLLLQLLILLLIILALADPYFSWQMLQARRLVLVIDNSASMRAADVAPSRLEAAKAAAIDIIDGLRYRDEVAVVLAGSSPEVLIGMSSHAPSLCQAIERIAFSDNSTGLKTAIDLGRQLIGEHPHGQVIVLTDGAVDDMKLFTSQEGEAPAEPSPAPDLPGGVITPVEYRLFATDASNIGITQLQVRRSLIDPLGYEILTSVHNASSSKLSCRLELTLNDVPVDVIPLNLEPEEQWSRSIEKTSLEGGRMHAVLTQIQSREEVADVPAGKSDVASAAALADAALPSDVNRLLTDDSAWALLPGREVQRVLIVSPGNLFLQKVFEANPLVEVTVRRDFPDQWPADTLVVLHGKVPEILPAGNVFVIDPIGNCDQWEQGAAMENPIVTEQDKTSSLMNHIRLDNVIMPEAKQLQFRTPPHALATTLSGESVYAEVKRPEGKCLVLSINLDRSDLAFRTAFPIMVSNSLGWFSGSTGEWQPALPAGAVSTIVLPERFGASGDVDLVEPDGNLAAVIGRSAAADSATAVVHSGDSGVTVGPLNRVGVWSVRSHTENAAAATAPPETVLTEIAVNLADRRETDLRPLSELVESPQSRFTTAGWFTRPLWYYVVLLTCLLTTVEWFLYQRRLIA